MRTKKENLSEMGEDQENTHNNSDFHLQFFGRSSNTRASSFDSAIGSTPALLENFDSEFRGLLAPRCGRMLKKQLDAVRAEPPKTLWHIFLLSRTFRDKCQQHVAETLVEVLHLDLEEAMKKASNANASQRKMAVIHRCSEREDAFAKVQQLRRKGLMVQIASESGLPGAVLPPQWSNSPRRASYSEVFEKASEMKFTGIVEQPRKTLQSLTIGLPPAETTPRRASSKGRRKSGSVYDGSEMPKVQEEDVESSTPWPDKAKAEPDKDRTCRQVQPAPVLLECSTEGLAKFDFEGIMPCAQACQRPSGHEHHPTGAPTATQRRDSRAQCKQLQDLLGKDTSKRQGSACQVRQSKASRLWGTVFDSLKEHCDGKKDIEAKRDACRVLRCFVFGKVGNEDAKTVAERDAIFREQVGSLQQVRLLHNLWRHLDEDNSGRVDLIEFRACAESHIRQLYEVGGATHIAEESRQGDMSQFANGICEKVERHLLGKKSSFSIDDMMKLLWLAATPCDIKTMKSWCSEFVADAARSRLGSPPILELSEYEDLCSVFRHFDEENRGEIKFIKLVDRGLIYPESYEQCIRDWDADNNGALSMREFCEMMCPAGFRACEDSKVGTLKDGRRVIFDCHIDGWRLEKQPSAGSE